MRENYILTKTTNNKKPIGCYTQNLKIFRIEDLIQKNQNNEK